MSRPESDDGHWTPLVAQPLGALPPTVLTSLPPQEQAHRLDLLADWVAWLTDRYRLDHRTIPPCWPEHGELIEELAALHLAWEAAYGQLAHGDAPLLWHEHLDTARRRLSDAVASSGCRARAHRSEP